MADTIYFAVENLIEKTIIFSLMVFPEINCIKSPFLQNSFFVNLFLEEEMVYAYIRVSTDSKKLCHKRNAFSDFLAIRIQNTQIEYCDALRISGHVTAKRLFSIWILPMSKHSKGL